MNLEKVLREAHTVAVIGCSDNPYRASNQAASMLSIGGYAVIPVNPKYRSVNGIPCHRDFDEIPDDVEIDLVNVFRQSGATLGVVQAIIKRARRTGKKPVIWTQPGVSSEKAEEAARTAGFEYVRGRCIMTELAALTTGG